MEARQEGVAVVVSRIIAFRRLAAGDQSVQHVHDHLQERLGMNRLRTRNTAADYRPACVISLMKSTCIPS